MIKTSYQTPELRDANDNIIQSGAFGKNTALSNSTNDGWIDYVMNNLEALHDVVGETSPTLDGNGHVVEPANKAIGDEDGLRIKNNYLKLSGGKVTGVTSFRTNLRMLDNQDNRWGGLYVPGTTSSVQYLSLYGGTAAVGDSRLNLYALGSGKFELVGYSADGANAYRLSHSDNGDLQWRGYSLALKKDVLPLAGGTLSGWLQFSSQSSRICVSRSSTNHDGDIAIYGGYGYTTGAYLYLNGAGRASGAGWFGLRAVTDGSNYKELQGRPDGTLTWAGSAVWTGNVTAEQTPTLDATNVLSNSELTYQKVGKLVYVSVKALRMSANATATYNEMPVATGFPTPAFTQRFSPLGVSDESAQPIPSVNVNGTMYVATRGTSIANKVLFGGFVYIAQ